MGKIKNWSRNKRQEGRREDVPDTRNPQPIRLHWNHDNYDAEVNVIERTDRDEHIYRVWVHDHEQEMPVDEHNVVGEAEDKESARKMAVEYMRNHPYPDGAKVYADQQFAYKATVLETDESDVTGEMMARIEHDEALPSTGIEEGEEGYIDVSDIDDAMELKPYERRQVRDFARNEDWIE
jgi:hypothetical protein